MSVMRNPTFSIVINTLNRAASLDATLNSFRWLKYGGDFEVIVVNGPSTDDTEAVLKKWGSAVRTGRCPVANLSVSRNIGICMARGELVAFIDDDAIPEPEWLAQLAEAYLDPQVGAAGGFVFDHTGYTFQATYCIADRFASATPFAPDPAPHLCYPKSQRFPHVLGANSSFRLKALLEIGGFDEEFEYYLDETDVCARIVDAGYLIAQLPNAFVHHKYAPSNIRGTNRVSRYRYPIIKNKIYFMFKHAREFNAMERLIHQQAWFLDAHGVDMANALASGAVDQEDMDRFKADSERAVEDGWRRGLEGVKPGAMIDEHKRNQWLGQFSPFTPLRKSDGLTVVLVSSSYPPENSGGIATFNRDLAQAFALRGNIVHVIAQSNGIDHVDFEDGVWVHRIVRKPHARPPEVVAAQLPQDIWDWSATALDEAKRIGTHRKIDVVEAPIWDCEGYAFMLDGEWPLVTSLQTTFHFWLDSHQAQREDATWMSEFGRPMLQAEQRLMQASHAIRSISHAIRRDIEEAYGFSFDPQRVLVRPLGMRPAELTSVELTEPDEPVVLFVGRLEQRKGIDVLLEAIPSVLEQYPRAKFRIVGNKNLPSPTGGTYADAFRASTAGRQWNARVDFDGHLSEADLLKAYADCDIFVAPSRFESFGLVFLEAMRVAKPVIGCSVGGMPEVVAKDECGLLVPPGDAGALAQALVRLLSDPALRRRMGQAGLARFEAKFSDKKMAKESIELYRLAIENHGARPSEDLLRP